MDLSFPQKFSSDMQEAFEYWKMKRMDALHHVEVSDKNAQALMNEMTAVENMSINKWIGKIISPVVSKLLSEKRDESLDEYDETQEKAHQTLSNGQGDSLADISGNAE